MVLILLINLFFLESAARYSQMLPELFSQHHEEMLGCKSTKTPWNGGGGEVVRSNRYKQGRRNDSGRPASWLFLFRTPAWSLKWFLFSPSSISSIHIQKKVCLFSFICLAGMLVWFLGDFLNYFFDNFLNVTYKYFKLVFFSVFMDEFWKIDPLFIFVALKYH